MQDNIEVNDTESEKEPDFCFKLVMLGNSGVGKTSLIKYEIKNTFINTINDNFELRKDCHIIKNNTINFIPQLEINFSDNIEITKIMIIEFKKELEEIFEDTNFSIIEINKGSLHFLITLQFIFKK